MRIEFFNDSILFHYQEIAIRNEMLSLKDVYV